MSDDLEVGDKVLYVGDEYLDPLGTEPALEPEHRGVVIRDNGENKPWRYDVLFLHTDGRHYPCEAHELELCDWVELT